ncbi:MAG: response regulator [Planctomycetes bacterium]|nr:response regulator [Planctomycetota bacterium]
MNQPDTTAILVVDDELSVTRVVSRWLSAQGYECERAADGQEALEALRRREFALLLTDIMMPGISGMELLEQAKEQFPRTAVIMLTAVEDRDTATRAVELGAYGYIIKPFEQNEVLINVTNALKRRSLEILRDQYEEQLEGTVQERTAEVRLSREEIALRLMAAQQYRHDETGAHIRRLGLYAEVMAKNMGKSDAECEMLRLAAPMHDVGKIGVPDSILLKPGKLSKDEFEIMKSHTTIGARILEGSKVSMLNLARDIALSHHEKLDGSGYPNGLSGTDIPASARIVAILDVYDALVHNRVYRPAMPEEKALAIIAEGRGSHFEAPLVDVFMDALPELRGIRAEVMEERPA